MIIRVLSSYLQYKILEIIYDSKFAGQLIFLGGTCLRIVHGNRRFSEDLDFDNTGLTEKQFLQLGKIIKRKLELEGYDIDLKYVMKGAWHCFFRFPDILYDSGLTGHREEKILIQLDTEPQQYKYQPETVILNKFDVFTTIFVTPLSLLLSQKFYAIINRKRHQGRDFFDTVFLLGKGITPDYKFLNEKNGISDSKQLRQEIIESCEHLNMEKIAKDVEPFLFERESRKKVIYFIQFIKQVL